MDYETGIILKLCSLSVNKLDYNLAKTEWRFTGEIIDNQKPIRYCGLCGHNIQYEYILVNQFNGCRLPVGSECVCNYFNVHYDKVKNELKNFKAKRSNAARYELKNILYPVIHKIEDRNKIRMEKVSFESAYKISDETRCAKNLINNICYGGKFGRSCLKELPKILEFHEIELDYNKIGELIRYA
jgi:hypothetical protein